MVNKVTLIGNLGPDPELFQTQSGRAVAQLSIATNEVWMKDGERQRRTEWHRVVVWGPRPERIAQLRKGTPVYVEGRLRTRTFINADNVEQVPPGLNCVATRWSTATDPILSRFLAVSTAL